jgi:type IV secretory pathway TrbD component
MSGCEVTVLTGEDAMRRPHTREQRTTIINGILCFVLILAMLQLWLLTATVNAYMGGDGAIVWPAAAASLVCVAFNYPLFRYLREMERPTGMPAN